ncbi:MAG: chalcone isomerase family protein [Kangiellaceae bacterium]|nr:chalcone isomerase family protein [Kangiellaceae bacterium]
MKKILIITILTLCHWNFNLFAADGQQVQPGKIVISDRPLIPTGYGLTKLLNRDYYLGRFAIDQAAVYRSPEDLVYIDAARQMEFKFLTDRKISGATFARNLAASMKINNESPSLKEHLTKIRAFKRFFTRSIKKGDVLRFDYHKSFGTRVYLNKRILGEIPNSSEFYRILLNTWLGERPPSARFKSGILGQNGDDYAISLQQQYESM